ncbi:hypothetical protein DM02DRAFT_633009 [Periconia macrospinosa]|uniref:Uncharacterized protein n=1 Tax=Periconia macrospinosa TaxID=97972 RepID=A0A2V1DCH4_9PLEO|nr:hypothetical protein DM02DRAFT_633009 [Periconia macrospinosa]
MASSSAQTAPSVQSMPPSRSPETWGQLEKRHSQEKARFEKDVNTRRRQLIEKHNLEKKKFWDDNADVIDLGSSDEPSKPLNETARGHGAAAAKPNDLQKPLRTPVKQTFDVSLNSPGLIRTPTTPKSSKSIKTPATPKSSKKRRRVKDVSGSDSDGDFNATSFGSPMRSTARLLNTPITNQGFRSMPIPILPQTPKHAFRAATPLPVVPPSTPTQTTPKPNQMTTPSPSTTQSVVGSRTPSSRTAKNQASSRIAEQARVRGLSAEADMNIDSAYEGDNDGNEFNAGNHATNVGMAATPGRLARNMREMSITPTPSPHPRAKKYNREEHLRDRATGDRALLSKRNTTEWVADQLAVCAPESMRNVDDGYDAAAFLAHFRANGSGIRGDMGFRGQLRVEGGTIIQDDGH